MKFRTAILVSIFALAVFGQTHGYAIAIQADLDAQAQADRQDVEPLSGAEKEKAILLIRQLGSADFEARQKATRDLWDIGKPALELLESTAKGSLNREARMRAKDVVSLIKVGVQPDADPEIVNCIVGFVDKEFAVRDRAIIKLVYLQQPKVAEKLIDLLPSKTDRKAHSKHCSRGLGVARDALRYNREEEFQEWMAIPATRETQKLFYHYTLWLDGKLDEEIERLKVEARDEIEAAAEFNKKFKNSKKPKVANGSKGNKKSKDSNSPPKQAKLKTLIGLLRFLERWDQALEWTDKVDNRKTRKDLTHSILMESGNWKGLAKLITDPDELTDKKEESEQPHNGLAYSANGYKKALVEFYAGNEKDFEATISGIEADIEEEFQKQEKRGAKPKRGNQKHAQFLRYTLDFERALKYTSLEKDSATFRMLQTHSRYKKLFEIFNLETYEERAKYFEGRARHIRSLQKQVERFTKGDSFPIFSGELKGNNDENRDRYIEKRDAAVANWSKTCNLLADLGFDEEAELYTRRLYFDMRDNVPLGYSAIQNLARMCAYESAWEIAELECDRTTNFSPLGSLLNPQGQNHEASQLLDRHFRKKIKDPIERCRKVASLIRSPAITQPAEVDFWNDIADVDLSTNANSVWHLFAIWDVKEQELVRRTRTKETKSMEEMDDQRELLQEAQKYEALALTSDNVSQYARAWYAYSRIDKRESARRMRLLFASFFNADDAYEYTSGYVGTGWQSLPFDLFRLNDCLHNDEVGNNCYYMWKMTENDTHSVVPANQKMVRTQIVRLRYIESPYFDGSENDHSTFIKGAIRTGEVESASRWFKKLSDFEPADAGFVEKNFSAFEKLNNPEFLDEMFQKVSADFYGILSMFPNSAVHLNNYAWACACAKRNVDNGIEIAKRAVELRPGIPGYRDTLAELYHVKGRHDKAIETIRRAIEINPMKANYHGQLEKFRKAQKAAAAE